MEPTLLLHGIGWGADNPAENVAPGIVIGGVSGAEVDRVYRQLCRSRHVDGGEALMFEVYVSVIRGSMFDDRNVDEVDPASTVARIANLLVVATETPVSYARMIWPGTEEWPGASTALLWRIAEWTWLLDGANVWPTITTDTVRDVRTMWRLAALKRNANRSEGRLNTALTYFQHAWRSHHAEQACLHLAVALEVLFAPHTQSETTHQIAFNLAHFQGKTMTDRETLYEATRRFYSVRSAIIHGGTADDAKLNPAVAEMYKLIASALRRILTSDDLAAAFESEKLRRELLRSYLFV